MNRISLLSIPMDILRAIIDECENHPGSLLNLLQLNRALHKIVLPILYRKVDLSVHNRGLVPVPSRARPGIDPEAYWADKNDQNTYENWPPQANFLTTLLKYPSYGAYVHSFTWTIIWSLYCEMTLSYKDSKLWNQPELYRVFETLTNVRELDLACVHDSVYSTTVSVIRESTPKRLFYSARTIRLLGWMHRGLIMSILAPVLPRVPIQRLILDGLQLEGSGEFGQPITEEQYKDRLDTFSNISYTGDGVSCPGPAYNILPEVLLRCSSTLTHLELRKPGQELSQWSHYSQGLWSAQIDELVYAEWANFLKCVCQNLVSLTVEQARPHRQSRYAESAIESEFPSWRFVRPMDTRFMAILFPVLISLRWPKLLHMNIRGVAAHALDKNAMEALRSVLPPEAVLTVSANPSRPCYKFSGYIQV